MAQAGTKGSRAPEAAADDAAARTRTLEDELLAILARQARRVPVPVFLVGVVIAAMVWPQLPEHDISRVWPVAWLCLVAAVLVLRWTVLGRLPSLTGSVKTRLKIAVGLSALNGVTHGLSLGFFFLLPDFERAIQSMLLIGLCAGSVATTAGYMPVFLAYVTPTLVPLAIVWGIGGNPATSSWVESVAALLFVFVGLVLLMLARESHDLLKLSFRIRQEKDQLLDAKTRILSVASHDMRQPLDGLSLFTAALSLRPLDPRSREIVDSMAESISVLGSEFDALDEISRADAGRVRVDLQPVELCHIAVRVCRTLAAKAREKNLEVEIDCPEGLYVETDRLLFEGILRNLVDNAIKYTPAGKVSVRAGMKAGKVEVIVSDTGVGIAADRQPLVYQEYYQIDNPERDRTKGSGLGLSIVKRHVDLLKIPITLRSEPGVGTTFALTLEPADSPARDAPAAAPRADVSLEGVRVLLVEDNATARIATRHLLENLGCSVAAAEGTAQATQSARTVPPDLVLADFHLGAGDTGLKAVEALREIHPGVPALIMSSDTTEERASEVRAAGLKLLSKALGPERLRKEIAVATGRLADDVVRMT